MKRNNAHLIPGHYEANMLLRGALRRYAKYGGTFNTADLRSIAYAAARLLHRARAQGVPESELRYPNERNENHVF